MRAFLDAGGIEKAFRCSDLKAFVIIGGEPLSRKQVHLFLQMLGEERLGALFISALNSTQKLALLLSDHHEKRRGVLRQVGGRLLEVRDERSGENLKHTVAAGFEQNQMEFAVPAVGFLRIAGIGLNAADGVVESPAQCGPQ